MSGTESYSYRVSTWGAKWGNVVRASDGAAIPCDAENTDFQAYLAWLEAGNTAPEGAPTPETFP
jgi:hypothetical protein